MKKDASVSKPVQAVTKEQIRKQMKDRVFPDFVIQSFNECIAESKQAHSNTVLQKDVVKRICKLGKVTSATVFKKDWLDVEDFFRKAGWTVKFDQPAYCESFEAYFEFT